MLKKTTRKCGMKIGKDLISWMTETIDKEIWKESDNRKFENWTEVRPELPIGLSTNTSNGLMEGFLRITHLIQVFNRNDNEEFLLVSICMEETLKLLSRTS
jgi:hypothetical protein